MGFVKRKDFSRVQKQLEDAIAEAAQPRAAVGSAHSSVQHLRSIHEQIDAIGRGDLDAAIGNAHPSVKLDIYAPPEFPWIRHTVGVPELRQALQQNFDSVENQQPEITTLTVQGDTVILIGREHGRIKSTGAAYEMEFVQRFCFRDGRLESVTIIAARK
jgi:ketosteroid isomerase-like protein